MMIILVIMLLLSAAIGWILSGKLVAALAKKWKNKGFLFLLRIALTVIILLILYPILSFLALFVSGQTA